MTWDGAPGRGIQCWQPATRQRLARVIHLSAMQMLRVALATATLGLGLAACQPGVKASKDGALLFDTSCAQCHGRDGRGAPAFKGLGVPDFTSAALQQKLSDADMMKVIQNGSQSRKMPPWRGLYSDEQIRALVAHVRTFRP
jgi:cytochrome c6